MSLSVGSMVLPGSLHVSLPKVSVHLEQPGWQPCEKKRQPPPRHSPAPASVFGTPVALRGGGCCIWAWPATTGSTAARAAATFMAAHGSVAA